jgi:hypothetical protein
MRVARSTSLNNSEMVIMYIFVEIIQLCSDFLVGRQFVHIWKLLCFTLAPRTFFLCAFFKSSMHLCINRQL